MMKTRDRISLVAGILTGLTLLVSGTGKILATEEVPAQVVDFISHIIPIIFMTPATLRFLYDVLVPHVIPWAELILGVCLLIGFLPRLMAALTIPLLLAFLGTNLWSITQGGYATCASCFGIWEKYFGSFTPVQSLTYDLVLLAFAIVIIIFHSGGFFTSRRWLENLGTGKRLDAATLKLKMRAFAEHLRNLGAKAMAGLRMVGESARQHTRIAYIVGICLLGLITYGMIAAVTNTTAPKNGTTVEIPVVSQISVSEVSETSAVISWMTDKPAVSSVQVYIKDSGFTVIVTEKNLVTDHRMPIGRLSPDTIYHFKILSGDKQVLSQEHSFTTTAEVAGPFVISDVRVSDMTESSTTITWVTNRPATSEVRYWALGYTELNTVSQGELITNHRLDLVDLEPDAIYYFIVKSTDDRGSEATSTRYLMSAKIGKQAPDFTLNSLDGRTITLSDYGGKLVILDFWIWSCSACREKLPLLEEAYKTMSAEKVAILSIHFMGKKSVIQKYAEGEKLTLPILLDVEGTVSDSYEVPAFPAVFFIDGDGLIQLIDPEFSNAQELENILNSMLGDSSE